MRYTKSDIKVMFKRLLKALNKEEGPLMLLDNSDNVNHYPGGYCLNYSSVYGGYVIEEEMEGGGISNPFGCMRRNGREMYLSMYMTAQALEDIRYRQEQLNKYEVV